MERASSSPRKSKAKNKGTFTFVDDEGIPSKSTLVDRPPVVFNKRATRSGKEFHSTRRSDGSEESAGDSNSDVPKRGKLTRRKRRKEEYVWWPWCTV